MVFIVAGLIGQSNLWDQPLGARRLELLAGDQPGALAAADVEIGSHGLAHRRLDGLGAAELREELVDSAQRLTVHGSAPPRTMSYPYGAWSATAAAAVRSAGYELAFTIRPGVVRAHSDRAARPRVEVLAADSSCRLAIKVATAGWPRRWREPVLRVLDRGLVG